MVLLASYSIISVLTLNLLAHALKLLREQSASLSTSAYIELDFFIYIRISLDCHWLGIMSVIRHIKASLLD